MPHRLLFAAALIGAALVAVAGVGAKDTVATLKGEVYGNNAFKIEMKTSANAPLKTVKAGTYRITVEDKGSIHDFHLTGPGVNKATGVAFVGTKSWTVTLKRGTYRFVCDPHVAFMHGSFRVT